MPNNMRINPTLLNNVYWFLVSLGLALFVWIIANNQVDPVQEHDFREPITIQVANLTDGLMVVEQAKETVTVTVRAQQSVLDDLEPDDIIVTADLDDLGAGIHTVELEAKASRRASIDTQPRQITVILEEIQTQQVRVELDITQPPPPGYEYGDPYFSESQVTISGAISQVQQVVVARARIDLSTQRDSLETDVHLVAVNAEGNAVRAVELSPQDIVISLPISRRKDVREVAVYPDVDLGSLTDGYDLTSFSYEPQTVLVVGEERALELLPDTLPTDVISLEGRTEDFEVSVPVVFPGASLPLLGEQVIIVTIHIVAQETTTQFEAIPVQMIGLGDDLAVEIIPEQVTVFISGPQSVVETLNAEDISVVIDLNGYTPGTYTITPQVSSIDAQIQAENIQVAEEITVTITMLAEEAEIPD